MKKRILILLLLSFQVTLLFSQINPIGDFLAYQWTNFELDSNEFLLKVDCDCIYRIDNRKIKVLSKHEKELIITLQSKTYEFFPKDNPDFDTNWTKLNSFSIPTPLTQNQVYVFKNFVGLWYIGKKAPEFKLENFEFSNQDFLGKLTVLNFWFAGCNPCMAEIPALNNVKKEFDENENIQFIAFSIDPKLNSHENYDFEHFTVSKEIAEKFFVFAYPRTFVIDKNGIIQDCFIGASVNENKLLETNLIEKIKNSL